MRYLLEGSVRKSAGRIRIAGQLIDASSGTHLWADRFEGAIEDVFELQDQVTANVVGAIAPRLEQAEIDRARRKPTESLDAYDLHLRGLANFYNWTREGNDEALRFFYKAIELDPEQGEGSSDEQAGMNRRTFIARDRRLRGRAPHRAGLDSR